MTYARFSEETFTEEPGGSHLRHSPSGHPVQASGRLLGRVGCLAGVARRIVTGPLRPRQCRETDTAKLRGALAHDLPSRYSSRPRRGEAEKGESAMRPVAFLVLSVVAAAPALAQPSHHVGPSSLYPNATATPGVVNPDVTQANINDTICKSGWTATIRPPASFTTALK